jgi:hypothetical protein
MLQVTRTSQGGTPVLAKPSAPAMWLALAWVADLALGLLALLCLLAMARTAGRELLVAAAMLAAAVILCLLPAGRVEYVERVFGGLPLLQVSFAVLAMLLLAVHIRGRRLSPVVLYLALSALALATMRQAYPSWDRVALRSAGNDNLSAESQARSILQTGSLQGEEAVYYSQPFYRYLKFAEHALFGEGDVLYGSMALLAALGGAFFALERLRSPGARGAWPAGLLGAAALLGLTGYYMARFVRDGMAGIPPGSRCCGPSALFAPAPGSPGRCCWAWHRLPATNFRAAPCRCFHCGCTVAAVGRAGLRRWRSSAEWGCCLSFTTWFTAEPSS